MPEQTLSIFAYFNYRDYLRDYFAYRKALNRHFSHRLFAQKAGYNSSGLYLLLIKGKQNLTAALIPKFIKALELQTREAEYFEHLINFTHAKTAAGKQNVFEKMIALLPANISHIGKNQRDYYASWTNIVIRETLSVLDVQEDYQVLAAFLSPAIKTSEAKASIKCLASLDLIRKNKQGFWRATKTSLKANPELGVAIIHPFQKTMIDLSKVALDNVSREERHIACSTFSISAQGLERLSGKIENFLAEIGELVRSDSKENRVYQFNVQLFPVTQSIP